MAKQRVFLILAVFLYRTCVCFDGDWCYDKTWYQAGSCGNLTSCEFSRDLMTARQPEICGYELGSSEPSVCCPFEISAPVYKPDVGKACYHKTWSIRGTCLPLENCASAKLEASKGIQPQRCGSGVCCVPSEISCVVQKNDICGCEQLNVTLHHPPKPKSVADSKCVEYSRYACPDPIWSLTKDYLKARINDHCPHHLYTIGTAVKEFSEDGYTVTSFSKAKHAIAGGMRVPRAQEYPHMALLGIGQRGQITFSCGGSLISPDFILTAAHCGQPRWALLGTLRRRSDASAKPTPRYQFNMEFGGPPQLLEVQEVIPHPEYSREASYNDIALLRLKEPARMTATVRPACLHTARNELGKWVMSAGWGDTSDGAELPSDVLMHALLRIRPLGNCSRVVDSRRLEKGLVDSHLCAGGEFEQDTCPGDSGGPLMFTKSFEEVHCMHSILGVVSFGALTCGTGNPAVYTRVSYFVPWIESIVWPQG